MQEKLLSAEEVKQYLQVSDFRSITKDKLIEFVSAIPYMDKDIAAKIIEQFPEFSRCAKEILAHLNSVVDVVAKGNDKTAQGVLDGYKQTLSILGTLAQRDDISAEERLYFAEQSVEIVNKMAAFDADNKHFLAEVLLSELCTVLGILLLLTLVLGVNIRGVKLPHIKK